MITLRKKTCFLASHKYIANTYEYLHLQEIRLFSSQMSLTFSNPLRQVQRIYADKNTVGSQCFALLHFLLKEKYTYLVAFGSMEACFSLIILFNVLHENETR